VQPVSEDRVPAWLTSTREAWLDDVTRWITRTTGAQGLGPLVDVTPVKERIWGAVLRVETSDRVLFFKAEGPGGRHEAVVLADIAATHPQLVPELLAVDLESGWLLMADHGSPMWDSMDPAAEIEIWEQIYPLYARMQRASAHNVERWIAAGTPDRRVHLVPALVDEVLAGGSVPLDRDRRRAIETTLPGLARVCDELAATGFAQAIDHADMHGGNVLVGRAEPRLSDWGDSCITHPFASLFVTYQHAVAKLPAGDRPDVTRRLRDVYLDAWTEDAPADELRDAFAKATWLGQLLRALNFVHQLGGPGEWGDSVAAFFVRWQEQYELIGRGDELIMAVANQRESEHDA
jgi:phosphotransferase family enzyme